MTDDNKTQTVEELYFERIEDKPTQAQMLVRIGHRAELFTSREGDAYATVRMGDHGATWSLTSDAFGHWLTHCLYQETGKVPFSTAINAARRALEAEAHFHGETHAVHTRVGGHDGAVYLDLGDDSWRAVKSRPRGGRSSRIRRSSSEEEASRRFRFPWPAARSRSCGASLT